jgi:hypothetical protein
MTMQCPEIFELDGRRYPLSDFPLCSFFRFAGRAPAFRANSSALWRGYVGTWEIIDDRLYLVSVEGEVEGGRIAVLATVFPGYPDRVFAHWYTGELLVQIDRPVDHDDEEDTVDRTDNERELLIGIERGRVIDRNVTNRMVRVPEKPQRVDWGRWLPFLDWWRVPAGRHA